LNDCLGGILPEMIGMAVGIDVAEARKGLDLVALDGDRRIVASRGRLSVDEVVEMVLCLRPAVVCIDSPSGWSRSGNSRLAERQLAAVGIRSYRIGPDPGDHPFYRWVRVGIEIYDQLSEDYPLYRGGGVAGTAVEVFPHATGSLLAGGLPATRRHKFELRRAVLREHRVQDHELPTADRVDATLGALTGLIALEGGHSAVGDPDEGLILLPVPKLPILLRPITDARERPCYGPRGRVRHHMGIAAGRRGRGG
jgi:predicted nuclease with RNAse H fold